MKKPNNQVIIDALTKHYGIVSNAAIELGCSRQSLAKWIERSYKLQTVKNNCRKSLEDLCVSKLVENIKAGKEASIFFTLKTQFGYKEKTDPLIQLKNELKINYIEPSPDEAPYKLEEKNNEKE